MKGFLKFLLSFLPWIAFGLLSGPPLVRLEVAIVFSFLLSIFMGYKELNKGFLLTWGTFLFFLVNIIFVVGFKNQWFMKHLGLFPSLTLACIAWISILVGKPFVLQIARESNPKEIWDTPEFYTSCRYISIVWGCLFLFSTAIAFANFFHIGGPKLLDSFLSVGSVVGGMIYTEWYKAKKRKEREQIAVKVP